MRDHDVPRTSRFEPFGWRGAFELDADVESLGGRGLDVPLI